MGRQCSCVGRCANATQRAVLHEIVEGQHHFDHSLRNMAAFYEERARRAGGARGGDDSFAARFDAMRRLASSAVCEQLKQDLERRLQPFGCLAVGTPAATETVPKLVRLRADRGWVEALYDVRETAQPVPLHRGRGHKEAALEEKPQFGHPLPLTTARCSTRGGTPARRATWIP